MRNRILFLLMALAVAIHAQNYEILGPTAVKPYEANAMKELGDYLAKRIDGTLKVGGLSPVVFHVGDTDLAKSLGCLSTQLREEEWIIKSIGNKVVLNGGGTRGVLYAVYHFLEDYCDIHWWNEYEEFIPTPSSLSLPALDAKGKPAFLYRDIYCYSKSEGHPEYTRFAIRNRLNRAGDLEVSSGLGGSFDYGPPYHCHTFAFYFPEEVYFKEHPEYFSLLGHRRVGGKRSQICLTNPELRKAFLEKLFDYIRQGDEEAAKQNVAPPRIYDISMNDSPGNFCECPECKAEIELYGYSGYVLRFVNYMAEKVAKTRPEIYISTLAYHVCEPPPKGGVRARDNVVVKLCDTRTNQAASKQEDDCKVFREFLAEWSKFAKNLFIWDYAITFVQGNTGIPFASEFHYGDLFRFYHENNVTGVFWEHERIDRADMYELKVFLENKLMEDPYQDVDELIAFFNSRYYGAAAQHILRIRRMIDEARKKNRGFISVYSQFSSFDFIDDDMLHELQSIFDQAENAVKGDEQLTLHVRRARMGLDNITARRANAVFYHGTNYKTNAKTMSPTEAALRFFDTYDKWTASFPNAKRMQRNVRNIVPVKTKVQKMIPAPKELEGRNFFDCYPIHFNIESRNGITVVEDAESPVGEAMRIDVKTSHYYNMPFAIGVYDKGFKKTLAEPQFNNIPDGAGYHWYKLPVLAMPSDGYVFITRSWTIQVPVPCRALYGKPFEVWISAKHVGEQFHEGQGKPEYIYVDRLVFIEPQ